MKKKIPWMIRLPRVHDWWITNRGSPSEGLVAEGL